MPENSNATCAKNNYRVELERFGWVRPSTRQGEKRRRTLEEVGKDGHTDLLGDEHSGCEKKVTGTETTGEGGRAKGDEGKRGGHFFLGGSPFFRGVSFFETSLLPPFAPIRLLA